MHMRSAILLLVLAVSTAAAGSCGDGPAGLSGRHVTRIDPRWVTGPAAAALDTNGQFILPAPANPTSREIDEREARAQAEAWARSIAQSPSGTREYLEREHKETIEFGDLRACGRTIYTLPAWGPVHDSAPAYVHNFVGPKWLVRLCSPDGEVPVVLSVAANSDLVWVDGRLQWPAHRSGNWFRSVGIPKGASIPDAVPMEPEAAVAVVVRATRRRVSEVPVFVEAVVGSDPAPLVAQCGAWLLTLEAPVRARGASTGAVYETRHVRVWRERCSAGSEQIQVAKRDQPPGAWRYIVPTLTSDSGGADSIAYAPVRIPYQFEALLLPLPEA